MSDHKDIPQMNSRKSAMRIRPSTSVKAKLLFKVCQRAFIPVAAANGTNLYMKMKKPMETTMLPIMAHEPISGFFSPSSLAISSRPTLSENFAATKPSFIAWPSVASPRTKGHPIHLCFSEGRCSFSLCVVISPDGLRMAMPQACGERIITPSTTAWPPTRVSSPPSRIGSSCRDTRKRRNGRQYLIVWLDDSSGLQMQTRRQLHFTPTLAVNRPNKLTGKGPTPGTCVKRCTPSVFRNGRVRGPADPVLLNLRKSIRNGEREVQHLSSFRRFNADGVGRTRPDGSVLQPEVKTSRGVHGNRAKNRRGEVRPVVDGDGIAGTGNTCSSPDSPFTSRPELGLRDGEGVRSHHVHGHRSRIAGQTVVVADRVIKGYISTAARSRREGNGSVEIRNRIAAGRRSDNRDCQRIKSVSGIRITVIRQDVNGYGGCDAGRSAVWICHRRMVHVLHIERNCGHVRIHAAGVVDIREAVWTGVGRR